MATYYSSTDSKGYRLRLDVSENTSSDGNINNYSTITWTLYIQSTGNYAFITSNNHYSVSINGQKIKNNVAISLDVSAGSTKKIDGGTTSKIYHDNDGKKSVTCSASFSPSSSAYYMPTSKSLNGTLALTTIPRKSNISATKYGMWITDNIILVTIDRKATNFTDTISWSCNGLSETIQTKGKNTKLALCFDDYSYNNESVPTGYSKLRSKYSNSDLMNKILTTTSQTINFTCTTYNGNTSIGTSTATFKYEIYMSPYINNPILTINDALTKELTGNDTTIIKNFSNVKITNNAKKDSGYNDNVGITSYSFNNSYESIKQSNNSYIFEKTKSNSYIVDLIDERGLSPIESITIKSDGFLEYFTPVINKLDTKRAESTSNVINFEIGGSFWNNSFGSITNSIILEYRYKINDGEFCEFKTITPVIKSNNFTYNGTISVNPENDTTIEVKVTDKTNTSYTLKKVEPKGQSIFDIGDDYFNVNGTLAVNGINLIDLIYPVGSIYMSVKNVSPQSFLGGTWTSWGAGRVPVGVDTAQTEFKTVEKTGGSKTQALTIEQLPTHNHWMHLLSKTQGTDTTSVSGVHYLNDSAIAWTSSKMTLHAPYFGTLDGAGMTSNTGSGEAHNNLQPYITCYMWKRTK